MDGILDRLFPASPVMGLLGDENMLQQARQQGLLGLAAGLLQAGGPSRTRTNIGQAIGSGLITGQQMYQQALDRQLQGQLTMEKVGEARRLREQQALARQLMPQLVQQGPATVAGMQQLVTRDEEGNLLPGYSPGAMQINQAAANALMSVLPPADFAKVMDAIKTQFELGKPPEPKTIKLGEGEQAFAVGPGGVATQIAAGTPKVEKPVQYTGDAATVALSAFGTADPNKLTPEQRAQIPQLIQQQKVAVASAGATRVDVSTGDKGGLKLIEQVAKDLPAQRSQAVEASRVNTMLDDILKLNQQRTFSGLLAPGFTGASQFLNSFGINVAPQMLANTREFQASTNLLVLDFMGAMGGAKGFSKEESAILYDAFPKIIDDPKSRARIVQMLKRRNDRLIDDYNRNLDTWNTFQRTGKLEFAPVGGSQGVIPQDLRDAARQQLGGQ